MKNRTTNWFLALALVTAGGLLGAAEMSAASVHPATAAETADEKPQPVNAKCPIMGGNAKDTVTTTWNGKTVGFCCPPCIKKWNDLSEAEKAKKLAASMK